MPIANIYTKYPKRTNDLVRQLQEQGYQVRILKPETQLVPADLEIEFEVVNSKEEALELAGALAEEISAFPQPEASVNPPSLPPPTKVLTPFAVRQSPEVPPTAYFLLLLIPKKFRESFVGDLEEEFRTIVLPQYGRRKATLWYWWHTILSLLPFITRFLKRAVGFALIAKLIGK